MTAAERMVRERYPDGARCERSVLEYALGKGFTVAVLVDGDWIGIGYGSTQTRAWHDATRSFRQAAT